MNNSDASGETTEAPTRSDRPARLADTDELSEFVAGADTALVEFYTNGCGICQSMEPVVGNVGRELDIPVGLVNPRDDPPLVEQFAVTGVPLLVLFVDGEPVARRDDGFLPGDELADWITRKRDQA